MFRFAKLTTAAAGVTALMLAFTAPASATIVWNFGTEFSGSGGTLSGPVVVTLEDGGGSGSVDVTIDTTGLNGALTEYVSALYLNLDPAIAPATLGIAIDGGAIDPTSATFGTDCCPADGDGIYDLVIQWANTAFTAGLTDTITYTLAGLEEEDFLFLSTPGGGAGTYVAALRARSLGTAGEDSGWFYPTGTPIPEPATLWLFGAGLIGLGAVARRRQKTA